MRTKRATTREALRLAIESLPRQTRVAMLAGLDSNEIIVGAYTSTDGICPMLAAHRGGVRTATLAFAKAWDRFAFGGSRAARSRRIGPRRATERELLLLRSYLETSLLVEDAYESELSIAHREHLELVRRREQAAAAALGAPARPAFASGGIDRSRELGERPGWAWTAVVRGVDDYQRALRRLEFELAEDPSLRAYEPALSN